MSTSDVRQEYRILLAGGNRETHCFLRDSLGRGGDSGRFQEASSEAAAEARISPFEVESAFEGQAGVAMVKAAVESRRCYSVAFVDARMGGAIVEMQRADPELQIVLCTDQSDVLWKTVLPPLGDSVMILKRPFEALEVVQLARTLSRKWALARYVSREAKELELAKQGEGRRASPPPYRSLFTSLSRGFFISEVIFDSEHEPSDLRVLDVNSVFEEVTNFKRKDVIGRTLREILSSRDGGWIRACGRVGLTGEPDHFEHYFETIGRHLETCAFSPSAGKVACVLVDLSARKKLERERQGLMDELNRQRKLLVATLDQIPAGVIVAEIPSGRILVANRAMTRIFGDSIDYDKGLGVFAQFNGIEKEREACCVRDWPLVRTARTGKTVFHEVRQIKLPDGSVRTVLASSTPVLDEAGQLIAAVGINVDLTAKDTA